MSNGQNADYQILRLFWHSRNVSFKVFRKAILTAEIVENPFGFGGFAPNPAGELTVLPKPPTWWEGTRWASPEPLPPKATLLRGWPSIITGLAWNLHVELDHFSEFLELGDDVDVPVRLLQVEPAAADITKTCTNSSPQCADPTVL